MRTIGIDPSTKTGFVCLEDGVVIDSKVIHYPDYTGYKRVQLIAQSVTGLVKEHKADRVAIEAFFLGKNLLPETLMAVAISIRLFMYQQGLNWVNVPPSVLKKFTTGKGGAKKEHMAEHVKARWGYENKSNDIIDAYALAQFAGNLSTYPLQSEFPGVSVGF